MSAIAGLTGELTVEGKDKWKKMLRVCFSKGIFWAPL